MKKTIIFTTAVLLLAVSAQKSFSQNNDGKIKKGIYKVWDMFNSGDFTGIENYIDAGYTEHSPAPGQVSGIQGLIDFFNSFRKSFPDAKFTINDIVIQGNKAAILNTVEGTNSGDFMGMPPTNKKITVVGIDWLVFNNDLKNTDHWGYWDSMGMMQQLGLSK